MNHKQSLTKWGAWRSSHQFTLFLLLLFPLIPQPVLPDREIILLSGSHNSEFDHEVRVLLYNASPRGLYIDDLNFAVGALSFEVIGPDGAVVPRKNVIVPEGPATVFLAAGHFIYTDLNLAEEYDLTKSGEYHITAIYTSIYNVEGREPFWRGTARARTLTIPGIGPKPC